MESCNVELIFDHVGHFGKFQIILYVICAYQNISCGMHYMASVFMSSIPEHACRPPGKIRRVLFHNLSAWSLEDVLALRSPDQKDHITVELQDGQIWELTKCSRTWRENKSHLNHESSGYGLDSSCSDGYVYDQSKWRNSVVENLNLVCERKWYAYMIQPLFIFGVLLGSIIFGYLSDRFGRRTVLWCTSIAVFFFGIASIFILDYFSFMAVRFLLIMSHKTLKTAAVLAVKTATGSALAFLFMYTAELYPTIIRCLAVGSSNMVSRMASFIIPFTNQVWIVLPQVLFGILAILSGLLSLKLPETLNKPLASTWEKTEQKAPENKAGSSETPPTAEKGGSGEAPPTAERGGSGDALPTAENTEMENTEVINLGDSDGDQ